MDKLKLVVSALEDKKARDIDVLDVSELTSLGDYFIICTCSSNVQVRACVDNVEEKLKEIGITDVHKEGYTGGTWVLMDVDGIIVHVMQEQTRDFYSLERLWDDAKKVEI